MNYSINKKLRKNINKEILSKRKSEFKVRYYLYQLLFIIARMGFIIPALLVTGKIIADYVMGRLTSENVIIWCTLWLMSFIFFMFFMIIPAAIRSKIHQKYLMPWVGDTTAWVEITDNYIENGFYNPWYGEHYWTNKIKFSQLVQIEYDENQKLFRVYGPMEIGEWTDETKSKCIQKTKADPDAGMNDWMEIPAFFDNFETLKKELAEKSGKEIVENKREYIYYH